MVNRRAWLSLINKVAELHNAFKCLNIDLEGTQFVIGSDGCFYLGRYHGIVNIIADALPASGCHIYPFTGYRGSVTSY